MLPPQSSQAGEGGLGSVVYGFGKGEEGETLDSGRREEEETHMQVWGPRAACPHSLCNTVPTWLPSYHLGAGIR